MKDLRIVLKGENPELFNRAKQRAERELGMTLRDNEFASRVLVQAIKQHQEEEFADSVCAGTKYDAIGRIIGIVRNPGEKDFEFNDRVRREIDENY